MKIIILFFALCVPVQAWELKGVAEYGSSTNYQDSLSFFNYELDFSVKTWEFTHTLYGGTRTWFYRDHEIYRPIRGYPFREIYTLGYKLKYNIFYVKIDHFCNHPVYSPKLQSEWHNNYYTETITSYVFGVEYKIKN